MHQMLVTFPIGAFGLSVTCDSMYSRSRQRKYATASRLALDFGLATAALAAPFGYLDYRGINPDTRAKRVGLIHALTNVTVLGLFATSRVLRARGYAPPAARWLAGAGLALSGIAAWFGGELITRHGIGVHDETGQNVASSLSRKGRRVPMPPPKRRPHWREDSVDVNYPLTQAQR